MSTMDVLRDYLARNFLFQSGGDPLGEDVSLLETGIIDSTGILELVNFVEESFQIKVPDGEIVPENFDSLRRIVNFVEQKRQGLTEQAA